MKKWVLLGLQISVTLVLLVVIFRREGFREDIGRVISGASTGWLIVALAAALVVHTICWLRWWVCLKILNLQASPGRSLRFFAISLFASLFLMGPVGGDAVRLGLMFRDDHSKAAATMSVLLDRLSGLMALVLGAVLFTGMRYSWFKQDALAVQMMHALWIFLIGSVIFMVVSFIISRKGWLRHLPRRAPMREGLISCAEAWDKFSRRPWLSLSTVGMSFVGLMIYFSVFVFCAMAFGLQIAWRDIFAVMTVVDAAVALPVSFAGLGLREKLFEVMMNRLAGVPPAAGVMVSLGGFVAMTVWNVVGGLFLPGYRSRRGEHIHLKDLQEEV